MFSSLWCCVHQEEGTASVVVDDKSAAVGRPSLSDDRPADETDGQPSQTVVPPPVDDVTDRHTVSLTTSEALYSEALQFAEAPSVQISGEASAKVPETVEMPEEDSSDAFRVIVEPGGQGTGLDLDTTDDLIAIVTRIRAGVIQDWNRQGDQTSGSPRNPVRVWDALVRVNGRRGSSKELIAMLDQPGKLQLMFRRPKELNVELKKEATMPLGMMLETTLSAGLIIAEILEGSLQSRCPEVRVHDHIISVNGKLGSPGDLWDLIEGDPVLKLKLLSYDRH
eukprot:TRINITY_DN27342_c0_g1_i1.p1 TRINITY_DN27342_c0_g1~~TRINITY_DN27342_c0_g1_i1.p1  ORF type:complete len:280 (+),score=41.71 TRINITY_DN27342_c0_g1_i1:58-897(+)